MLSNPFWLVLPKFLLFHTEVWTVFETALISANWYHFLLCLGLILRCCQKGQPQCCGCILTLFCIGLEACSFAKWSVEWIDLMKDVSLCVSFSIAASCQRGVFRHYWACKCTQNNFGSVRMDCLSEVIGWEGGVLFIILQSGKIYNWVWEYFWKVKNLVPENVYTDFGQLMLALAINATCVESWRRGLVLSWLP